MMKEMTIERSLEIKDIVAAEQVRLQCQMKYQNEEEGKRARGNIYVRGIYFDGEKKKALREIVALDVFAPNYKLMEDEEFSIEIKDSRYNIVNQNLILFIDLCVYGVNDDEQEEQEVFQEEVESDTVEADEINRFDDEVIELVEEVDEEALEEYDAFYQTEQKMGFRMIVLNDKSSYEILSSKYEVDLLLLKMLNCNKELVKGALVLLPDK